MDLYIIYIQVYAAHPTPLLPVASESIVCSSHLSAPLFLSSCRLFFPVPAFQNEGGHRARDLRSVRAAGRGARIGEAGDRAGGGRRRGGGRRPPPLGRPPLPGRQVTLLPSPHSGLTCVLPLLIQALFV